MNRTTKTIITIAVVAVLVIAVTLTLTSNKKEMAARVYHPDVNTAVTVQTDTVKAGAFDQSIPFTGSFSPNREVIIGSEASGKVIQVNVEEGSVVGTGQLIARLDKGVLEAQLSSAEASYNKAVVTLNRYQQAVSGVTQLQMDNAKTDILTGKAQIEQYKKQISQYTISAPFSGIITKRNFDLGAIVSAGTQMATLIDISSLKLEINVPEKSIGQFRYKQEIPITTDVYPNTVFRGTVDMVGAKADAAHNFIVKLLVPNPSSKLKAGMYGTVTLENNVSANTITIPRSALIGSAQQPQVYVVENGIARLKDIEVGTGNETRIQVINGLRANEVIVSGGLVNLKNGSNVKVAE